MAKTDASQMAAELCRKYPEHTARGLARMLREQLGGAITLEQARSQIRYVFGTRGKDKEKYAEVPREKRKAGQPAKPPMDWIPKSQSEPWKPIKLDGSRLGVISDIHIPYHDEQAVRAALVHLKKDKIDHLLINGDLCDFYASFNEAVIG